VGVTVTSEQWRSKEQILRDLAKAFHFSASSLAANRRGKLAWGQIRSTFFVLVRPLVFAAGFVLAPLFLWTVLAMLDGRGSSAESFTYVMSCLASPADLWADLGGLKTTLALIITLTGLVVGAIFAGRFSVALYFDLIDRVVLIREGRVESSEHELLRKNGKDPVENYYFHFKSEKFPVSRKAFKALDCGAAYYLYVLPRSRRLVAVEPKIRPSDPPDGA